MRKIFMYLIAVMLLFNVSVSAQTKTIEDYKAIFTTNFIRYINWDDFNKQGDFVIGVLNDKEVYESMKEYVGDKKFGHQQIVVKYYHNVNEVTQCNILYISEYIRSKDYPLIHNNTTKTFIITEYGRISNGSCVNFVIKDERLKFEVSPKNAEKYGLGIGSNLLRMKSAILVE